jgi:hypothetical protein
MEELLSLHRYYIWANRMREYFDANLDKSCDTEGPRAWFADDPGIFLSYWYSALLVVIEGWRELNLSDTEIDKLLTSDNVDLLRRYRNGVCHYQHQYFDPRFLNLISTSGVALWARQLNLAFGRYFLDRMQAEAKKR